MESFAALRWRHKGPDSVSNHQPHHCLLNCLFRRRSKKTSKLRVTGLCVGNSPGPVNSPHKWPVTRKMFPFDDVIMVLLALCQVHVHCKGTVIDLGDNMVPSSRFHGKHIVCFTISCHRMADFPISYHIHKFTCEKGDFHDHSRDCKSRFHLIFRPIPRFDTWKTSISSIMNTPQVYL